jgi:snurportin-1
VESERHIDLFAGLNLGLSDDETGKNDNPDIVRDGIAQLAPLLPRSDPDLASVPSRESHAAEEANSAGAQRKGWRKKATKSSIKKTSPWADKCMYAELLEMQETEQWAGGDDRLPSDLETGWVALAPVPVGKRCLAISHQGGGTTGTGTLFQGLFPHD